MSDGRDRQYEQALARCDALEARLAELESGRALPAALMRVDALGAIESCNGTLLDWLGGRRADLVGEQLEVLFDPSSAAEVAWLFRAGFLGADERRFMLRGGRLVTLAASHAEVGTDAWRVLLVDITSLALLDSAAEQHRAVDQVASIASAVTRDLNDPMSIVQGRMELLTELDDHRPEVVRRHLAVAVEHARRMSAALRNLRLVGRGPLPVLEVVRVQAAIDDALDLLGARRDEVSVEVLPADLEVGADPALLARVLSSVTRRALGAAPRHGGVLLRAVRSRSGVEVIVAARGEPAGRGVLDDDGPDVAIERSLLSAIGGVLGVRAGALVLELQAPTRARARPRRAEQAVLVCGSAEVASGFDELLGREGFNVLHAPDAEAALERVGAGGIDAVATELFLPGVSGLTLLRRLHEGSPDLRERLLLVTSYELFLPPAIARVVRTPLARVELLQALGRRVRRFY